MSDTEISYKENYVESLRQELVGIVEEKLSPLAEKYSYSKTRIRGRHKLEACCSCSR